MKSIKLIIAVFVILAFSFTSCHKKETVEVDNETQSVVDNAIAEQEFMAVIPAVNGVAIKTKGTGANDNGRSAIVPCDSLHIISGDTAFSSPTHVAPTYTMTFGTASCSPIPDAKVRAGDVKIKFYGRLINAGSRMVMNLINYKAANIDPLKKISYECDSIVVKTVSNDKTNKIRVFNVKIYNGRCVGPTGNWTTLYSTDRYIKHDEINDITYIWGSSNGTNREGRKFTVTVDQATPLTKKATCQFISFGILKLTPDGFKERTVDYSKDGADVCDDQATFSVNGNTVPFTLK